MNYFLSFNCSATKLDLSTDTSRTSSRSTSIESCVSSLKDNGESFQSIALEPSSHSKNDFLLHTKSAEGPTQTPSTKAKSKLTGNRAKTNSSPDVVEPKFDFEKYKGIMLKWNIGDGKGNLVRCEICNKYPDLVRQLCPNRKPPPITTSIGTGNRSCILNEHIETKYHLACMDKFKNDKLKGTGGNPVPIEIGRMISAANTQKANTISRYMMSIYTDAKSLTSSAYSWPGRILTSEYGCKYHINQPKQNENALQKMNMQYMSPAAHKDFLQSIVHVEKNLILQKLESCLAISLRADGSIDRTCIDKIYVLAKVVNTEGKLETLFLGVGEHEERGANGLYRTIEEIINKHGNNLWNKLLRKISSIVTDGASINVGEHNGLWRLIGNAALGACAQQPIMKIWCAAHRSDLAIKDLSKHVPEVPAAIKKCASISSFVPRSAVRLKLLKINCITL